LYWQKKREQDLILLNYLKTFLKFHNVLCPVNSITPEAIILWLIPKKLIDFVSNAHCIIKQDFLENQIILYGLFGYIEICVDLSKIDREAQINPNPRSLLSAFTKQIS